MAGILAPALDNARPRPPARRLPDHPRHPDHCRRTNLRQAADHQRTRQSGQRPHLHGAGAQPDTPEHRGNGPLGSPQPHARRAGRRGRQGSQRAHRSGTGGPGRCGAPRLHDHRHPGRTGHCLQHRAGGRQPAAGELCLPPGRHRRTQLGVRTLQRRHAGRPVTRSARSRAHPQQRAIRLRTQRTTRDTRPAHQCGSAFRTDQHPPRRHSHRRRAAQQQPPDAGPHP